MLNNTPTEEELNTIIKYFKTENEEEGYNLYIKGLIEKHGQKWVENALNYVIGIISVMK